MSDDRLRVRVARIRQEAEGIKSFELVAADGGRLPNFSPGAHLIFYLPIGLARQYSLCNDAAETNRYVVAVLKEPGGRGGSQYMHEQVRESDILEISSPRNNFPLKLDMDVSILIAGGIGVTPLLAMARQLKNQAKPFHLYYCSRSAERTAFRALLSAPPFTDQVTFIHDGGDPSKGLDVASLLRDRQAGAQVYCCGPAPLMNAVREAGAHWPSGTISFESFTADPAQDVDTSQDQGLEVVIQSTGAVLQVPADKTILEVLTDHGIEVESLCEEGYCGTCITDVVEGEPDHRDIVLTDEEKESNKLMTVCCSRALSKRLVLDL